MKRKKLLIDNVIALRDNGVDIEGSIHKEGEIITGKNEMPVDQTLLRLVSSTVLDGGTLSINALDNTKFDISAGVGAIVDNFTDTENPTCTKFEWDTIEAIPVTDLTTAGSTWVYIDSDGVVYQRTLPLTEEQQLDFLYLGILIHTNQSNLNAVSPITSPCIAPAARLNTFMRTIGPLTKGVLYSANGANLLLNKSAGTTAFPGLNFFNSKKLPDLLETPGRTAEPLLYTYRDGSGSFTFAPSAEIVPGQFDNGSGTLANVQNNRYTIQRLYHETSSLTTVVEYGQNVYNNLVDAAAALFTETHVSNPALAEVPLRAYIICRSNVTNLTAAIADGTARIIAGGLFARGNSSGAVVGSVTTLQAAYNNSEDPEITLNSIRGAFNIENASTPIAGALFGVSNFGGSIHHFKVHADGISVQSGTTIDNFSTDVTLSGNSDTTIPTEKAIKTYVDNNAGGATYDVEKRTSSFNATKGKTYLISSSSESIEVTLPAPELNAFVTLKDASFNANQFNIKVLQHDDENIEGVDGQYSIDSSGASITFVCDGDDWYIT